MALAFSFVGLVGLLWWATPKWLPRWIEQQMGGYRQRVAEASEARADSAPPGTTAAVIGGGLAGISAAEALARRGVTVTLFESAPELGGKCGSPMRPGPHSSSNPTAALVPVDHGFHAIFGHYYNLRALLERSGATGSLQPIGDYWILLRDGRRLTFADVARAPVINLVSLWRRGLFSFREIGLGERGKTMEAFLRHDPTETFARWDQASFDQIAEQAGLPKDLRVVFESFARAFFSTTDRLSAAALIQSFHFYFLSHDHGLLYDFVHTDAEAGLVAPLRRHLDGLGVTVRLDTPVEAIQPRDGGYRIAGDPFDAVVLATPGTVARRIVEASSDLVAQHPDLASTLGGIRQGQRYCVVRLWLEAAEPLDFDGPTFVATEGAPLLDAMAFVDRYAPDAKAWVAESPPDRRRSVVELHCYAIPDDVPDDAVATGLFAEAQHYLPALESATIEHRHEMIKRDFAAFHVGADAGRPSTRTPAPGLFLAGDWVKLPVPAMLMEGATTAGLYAANAMLDDLEVRLHPIETVPRRGLLTTLPQRRTS